MLFIGAQLLIWAVTGSYMVLMDIDYIHGDSLVKLNQQAIPVEQLKISIAEIKTRYPNAKKISLVNQQNQAIYLVKTEQWQRINAQTGEILPAVSQTQAIHIAQSLYTGSGKVVNSQFLTQSNGEISPNILPAWQINFDDFAAPRLYISAQTGELTTKRHSFWVLFDWFFRFHIMDYGDDEDASNTLLLVISVIALMASLAGLVLTYVSFVKVRGKAIQLPKHKTALNISRFLHRWLSLVVFAQLMIWIVTGLYFNLMDHRKASGNQYRTQLVHNIAQFNGNKLYPITQVVNHYPKAIRIELVERLNKPFYLVTVGQGLYQHFPREQRLIDGYSGESITLTQALAEQIALRSVKPDALTIIASSQLTPAPLAELPKHQNSAWQINLDNSEQTSIYVDSQSGAILGHVDNDKRLADLMFTLHFMDYRNLGHFNHWWLQLLALLTFIFALTGVYWVVHLIKQRQYRW
jgi:hypothetical protein